MKRGNVNFTLNSLILKIILNHKNINTLTIETFHKPWLRVPFSFFYITAHYYLPNTWCVVQFIFGESQFSLRKTTSYPFSLTFIYILPVNIHYDTIMHPTKISKPSISICFTLSWEESLPLNNIIKPTLFLSPYPALLMDSIHFLFYHVSWHTSQKKSFLESVLRDAHHVTCTHTLIRFFLLKTVHY